MNSEFPVSLARDPLVVVARYARDLQSSTVFHVSNRGNDRQDIFSVDFDRICFEENLLRMCDRYDAWIIAYAWMTNHFHALIELRDPENLPGAMRDFQSRYALGYNVRTKRTGSLFERPYFSKPVTDDAQFLQSGRYIHRNPISIVGPGRLAGYRQSSLGVYLGLRQPEPWLRIDRLAGLIDRDRYLEQLRGPHVWDRMPIDRLPPMKQTTIDEVLFAVEMLELETGRLADSTRQMLWFFMAERFRAATCTEIADRFGLHPATVRGAQRAGRVAYATDTGFEVLVNRAMSAMS